MLTGDPIDARSALEAGLVRRVVPDARVEVEALELAARMARHSGAALKLAKRALRLRFGESRSRALSGAGDLYVEEIMRTHDAMEGLQAFMQKRPPLWTHR